VRKSTHEKLPPRRPKHVVENGTNKVKELRDLKIKN
jgi:hypothetical protein